MNWLNWDGNFFLLLWVPCTNSFFFFFFFFFFFDEGLRWSIVSGKFHLFRRCLSTLHVLSLRVPQLPLLYNASGPCGGLVNANMLAGRKHGSLPINSKKKTALLAGCCEEPVKLVSWCSVLCDLIQLVAFLRSLALIVSYAIIGTKKRYIVWVSLRSFRNFREKKQKKKTEKNQIASKGLAVNVSFAKTWACLSDGQFVPHWKTRDFRERLFFVNFVNWANLRKFIFTKGFFKHILIGERPQFTKIKIY